MSRTYKDKPYKLKPVNDWSQDKEYIHPIFGDDYYISGYHIERPTTKAKKRKEVDTEDHWMTTPSWWTKMTMIRPERRAAHLLEVKTLKTLDLEDVDFPDLGKKPYVYFW